MLNINELDANQVAALARLRQVGGEQVFKIIDVFIDYAQQELNTAADTVQIHRLQGQIAAFQYFKQATKDAAEIDSRSDRVY